jgi:hypothetical protein
MGQMMSMPIEYRGKEYYALVRYTNKDEKTFLRVTVMNGDLEKMICGNDLFELRNGKVIDPNNDLKCAELKQAILTALEQCVCHAA